MNTRIVIVTNGALNDKIVREILSTDFVIGVDRAAHWLIFHGKIPNVAIGDFDSVTREELKGIQKNVSDVKQYPPEKDFTDTELAVDYALTQKPKEIVIYGGVGTRIDHTLANIGLLERCWNAGVSAAIVNETNEIRLYGRGRTILDKRGEYRYVSVLPISESVTISLIGLKYPLKRKTIKFGMTLGVSNEFASKQATITIHRGKALIIQSRD